MDFDGGDMGSFIPIIILSSLGLIMGLILSYESKKNNVKKDELVDKIKGVLPGVNCGACGFLSCKNYAEEIVKGAEITLCSLGGDDLTEVLEKITGRNIEESEEKVARVFCQGDNVKVKKLYQFDGEIKTCANANLYFGGDKTCMYACLGYGDCRRICPVNAIYSNEKGIVIVNENLCISCEKCVKSCPKKVIRMVPKRSKISVLCCNKEKAQAAKLNCSVACIACFLCEKSCPVNAIEIKNNLAKIDSEKCINCGICALKCPTNSIKSELKEYRIATIKNEKCIGCLLCKKVCPVGAIEGELNQKHSIIEHKCIGCGLCFESCKYSALEMRNKIIKD